MSTTQEPALTAQKTQGSGVGVLDKVALIFDALEAKPATLAQLVNATHLPRPTVHRLALALTYHRFLQRTEPGLFSIGSRIKELAVASGDDYLLRAANPVLTALRDTTKESAQLYCRQGDMRVCIANAEPPIGLRDSIPVGATLTMQAGSAAQILLAWESPERLHRGLQGARFNAVMLSTVRRRGWAQSAGEREPGVASVSAPVRRQDGRVVAAISVSGPIERMGRQPGRLHGATVVAAAHKLSEVMQELQAAHEFSPTN